MRPKNSKFQIGVGKVTLESENQIYNVDLKNAIVLSVDLAMDQ